ncbi:unnamed protein product [Calypogeia fissa]
MMMESTWGYRSWLYVLLSLTVLSLWNTGCSANGDEHTWQCYDQHNAPKKMKHEDVINLFKQIEDAAAGAGAARVIAVQDGPAVKEFEVGTAAFYLLKIHQGDIHLRVADLHQAAQEIQRRCFATQQDSYFGGMMKSPQVNAIIKHSEDPELVALDCFPKAPQMNPIDVKILVEGVANHYKKEWPLEANDEPVDVQELKSATISIRSNKDFIGTQGQPVKATIREHIAPAAKFVGDHCCFHSALMIGCPGGQKNILIKWRNPARNRDEVIASIDVILKHSGMDWDPRHGPHFTNY